MNAEEAEDGYRSSDDEDYVPKDCEDDVDEPSGDEVEEVSGKGEGILTKKRRDISKTTRAIVSSSKEEDIDELFAQLVGDDSFLKKVKEREQVNISNDRTSCPSTSSESDKSIEVRKVIRESFDFAGDEFTRTGLGEALTMIAKKPKISVLDKSSHDWSSFKSANNLKEDLATHNRGKNGYLNRMDFLSRTDYREFENEKSMRLSSRKN